MIIFLGDKKLGDNGVGDNGLGDSWLGENGNRPERSIPQSIGMKLALMFFCFFSIYQFSWVLKSP